MASKLYFYPNADGDLEKIDLGFYASEVHPKPWRAVSQVRSGLGSVYNTVHGGGLSVKIMLELGQDETLAERLYALEKYLKEGQPCSFAFDHTQTFCATLETEPVRGSTYLDNNSNVFYAYESDLAVGVGDELVVQSPLPEYRSEIVTVSAVATGRITVGALKFTYTGSPVIVRHKHFYPLLVLAQGEHERDLLTSNHGTDWVFNAMFIEDTAALHNIEAQNVSSSYDGVESGGALQRYHRGTASSGAAASTTAIPGSSGFL